MPDSVRDAIAASRVSSRAAVAQWRAGEAYRAMEAAFAGAGGDEAEPAAERAEALLGDGGWVAALLEPMVAALAEDPFFEPPFKASRDRVRTGALLYDCPAASITASVTSASAMAALPEPATMVFSGRVSVTRTIRSGGAALRRWRAEPIDSRFAAAAAALCMPVPALAPAEGDVHRCDGRREARLLWPAGSDVVTLVATIRAGAEPLMREYAVNSRTLVRVASADDRASRTEMLLAFLRAAGRPDAGAGFEAATRDPAFHLRWAAMREWLALDAGAAVGRLAEMAQGDDHAEVRGAAARTLPFVERRIAEARCRG